MRHLIAALVLLLVAAFGVSGCSGTSQSPRATAPTTASASRQTVLPFTGLETPGDLAVDAAGNVYVTDTHQVKVDNGFPNVTTRVIKLPAGSNAQPVLPQFVQSQLTTDPAGAVWVIDTGNEKLVKLAAGTDTQTVLPLPQPDPSLRGGVLAIDAAGNAYGLYGGGVFPGGGCRVPIQVMKSEVGSRAPTLLPFTNILFADEVAVDAAGNVYVGDRNRVLKLAPGADTQTGAAAQAQHRDVRPRPPQRPHRYGGGLGRQRVCGRCRPEAGAEVAGRGGCADRASVHRPQGTGKGGGGRRGQRLRHRHRQPPGAETCRRPNVIRTALIALMGVTVVAGTAGCGTRSIAHQTSSTATSAAATTSPAPPSVAAQGQSALYRPQRNGPPDQTCHVHAATFTYQIDMTFPLDYPDMQRTARPGRLSRTRETEALGGVLRAKLPAGSQLAQCEPGWSWNVVTNVCKPSPPPPPWWKPPPSYAPPWVPPPPWAPSVNPVWIPASSIGAFAVGPVWVPL